MDAFDPWYLENLVCPRDRCPLQLSGDFLVSAAGRRYPIVEGIPVMLLDDKTPTIGVMRASIERANGTPGAADMRAPEFYLETLGISEDEKVRLIELRNMAGEEIDPVVSVIIGATSGYAYEHLIGKAGVERYPIPDIKLTSSTGETLLDIGCNWGRWTISAAMRGFRPVGIDPSLGAVLAARRVASKLGLAARFVVGDARYLPFRDGLFDRVFSYSVLQHFSKDDARAAFGEAGRVLKAGGRARIQMAHWAGIRSLQHQLRRRFREPRDFEVRYWSLSDLRKNVSARIGPTKITPDCFFGLGWQWSDYRIMPARLKPILIASEGLVRASSAFPSLCRVCDSVFCTATKSAVTAGKGAA